MKTINFELSKRLNDLGLLDNITTEYFIPKLGYVGNCSYNPYLISQKNEMYKTGKLKSSDEIYKTLTLEEAIEFLPGILDIKHIENSSNIDYYYLEINKGKMYYKIRYLHNDGNQILIEFGMVDTVLEAIEKMLEYLLNNNLLGQENK